MLPPSTRIPPNRLPYLKPGSKFNRWTVVSQPLAKGPKLYYEFKCECGTVRTLPRYPVENGKTKSCGCLKIELARGRPSGNKSHGLWLSGTWYSWSAMKNRCHNKNSPDYKDYGARGISVCPRWFHSFVDFVADMGERPRGMTLGRIENNKNYEPGNCRWEDRYQQQNNTRANHMITVGDETMTVTNASRKFGIPDYILFKRLQYGWPVSRAIATPFKKRNRL